MLKEPTHIKAPLVFADSQSQNKKPKELTISQFKAVANMYREVLPVYIKNYINLEKFAA